MLAGNVFRLKGNILCMALLDTKGVLVTTAGEKWEESPLASGGGSNAASTSSASASACAENSEQQRPSKLVGNSKEAPVASSNLPPTSSNASASASIVEAKRDKFLNVRSMTSMNVTASASAAASAGAGTGSCSVDGGNGGEQRQFAVVCSEKQARVVALPSCVCLHSLGITESSVVLRAAIIKLKGWPDAHSTLYSYNACTLYSPISPTLMQVAFIENFLLALIRMSLAFTS